MLILTRRVGETLMIGDEVTVTVLGVKGNQVRIGVNAPKRFRFTVKKSISAFRQRSLSRRLTDSEAASRCQTRRYCIVLSTSFVIPLFFVIIFPVSFLLCCYRRCGCLLIKRPFAVKSPMLGANCANAHELGKIV